MQTGPRTRCAPAPGRASAAAAQRGVAKTQKRALSARIQRTQPQMWLCNSDLMQLRVVRCGANEAHLADFSAASYSE